MEHLGHALWVAGAYLVGAIPFTLLICRAFGRVDLRQIGSGNLGATNLYRVMGWKGALPAGLLDVAKGALPVLLVQRFGPHDWFPVAVGVAAIAGHVFSPFVGFRGGKGVATAAGVFAALAPWSVLVAGAVWAVVVKVSGYVSLGSMIAAGAFLASVPVLYRGNAALLAAAAAAFLFIVFTHRANIRRLLDGTENRFGRRAAPASDGAGLA